MISFEKFYCKPLGLMILTALAGAAHATETLTLSGLHTNTNVSWTLAGNTELSGSGAFYGSYNNGSSTSVDPLYCIDLFGWVTTPSTFAVQKQVTYTGAGWLAQTYGAAASTNSLLASALQFAIWNATYDSDLTVSGGNFTVNGDSFSGAAIAQANTYLAAMGTNKAYAFSYIRTGADGQSQISATPVPAGAVPGPAAAAPFIAGALGALRRRRKA